LHKVVLHKVDSNDDTSSGKQKILDKTQDSQIEFLRRARDDARSQILKQSCAKEHSGLADLYSTDRTSNLPSGDIIESDADGVRDLKKILKEQKKQILKLRKENTE